MFHLYIWWEKLFRFMGKSWLLHQLICMRCRIFSNCCSLFYHLFKVSSCMLISSAAHLKAQICMRDIMVVSFLYFRPAESIAYETWNAHPKFRHKIGLALTHFLNFLLFNSGCFVELHIRFSVCKLISFAAAYASVAVSLLLFGRGRDLLRMALLNTAH